MIENIYNNKFLKYPLSENEYKEIENTWNFLNKFNKPFVFVTDYRDYIIKEINKNYNTNEFYFYESVLNKLFWNLRWLLYPLFQFQNITKEEYINIINNNYNNKEELPEGLLLCKKKKYTNEDDIEKELKEGILNNNFYRSFINKLVIIDKENQIIYAKEMEGSSDIFSKNYFNLLTFTILLKRELYEEIMMDPFIIKNKNIILPKYYHQYDYAFPNLNFCSYLIGSEKDMKNRIKKLYYNKTHHSKYWFKIIK